MNLRRHPLPLKHLGAVSFFQRYDAPLARAVLVAGGFALATLLCAFLLR